MEVTIYHNPRCSKSRATLALLQERGIEPRVVLYLETPPGTQQICELLGLLGMTPRELIRSGEKEYRDLGLQDSSTTDDELVSAMHNCPRLMQRPIVVANGAARIGRPPESVLDIL